MSENRRSYQLPPLKIKPAGLDNPDMVLTQNEFTTKVTDEDQIKTNGDPIRKEIRKVNEDLWTVGSHIEGNGFGP